MSKKRLGKGLDALLPNNEATIEVKDGQQGVIKIPIKDIEPNPYQPRKQFDEGSLKELSESIKEHGVIQPISVRKIGNKYQLVAGERRLRASKMANLTTIPAIEKDIDDRQMMEIALIENIQRDDLNPIEEAEAYKQLMEQFEMTQEDLSKRVGKSRSTIANTIRLLNLPEEIQEIVSRETISMGHARALLSLDDKKLMISVCNRCIQEGMNVRQLEEYIKKLKEKNTQSEKKAVQEQDNFIKKFEETLTDKFKDFGVKVKINTKKDKSIIMMECNGQDDLKRFIEKLMQ